METGHLNEMALATIRDVAAAVQISVRLDARWRGPELAVLFDEHHSRIVDRTVRHLAERGWETVVEYTFNIYGERGSVDVLAWQASARALLIIEVKTSLVDLQETLSTFDRKVRVVRSAAPKQFGWAAAVEASVLVLADDPANRTAVARRSGIFAAAFPARTVQVRRWLANPDCPLRGLWFLSDTRLRGAIEKRGGSRRIRRPKAAMSQPSPRAAERDRRAESGSRALEPASDVR